MSGSYDGLPPSASVTVQSVDGVTLGPATSSGSTPERRMSASPGSPWSSAPFPLERGLVDTRIRKIRPLIPPACLLEELPTPMHTQAHIIRARREAHRIIQGEDERLIVVIGPCSIHDPAAAIEYAHKLLPFVEKYKQDLHICMRAYLEKPRTTVRFSHCTHTTHRAAFRWHKLCLTPTLSAKKIVSVVLTFVFSLVVVVRLASCFCCFFFSRLAGRV
jgi:hypothetical protein